MGKSWGDRESLDASEPRDVEEPTCPLCGTRIAHPLEPGGTVLCHPERGGCGVTVRPAPYLTSPKGERAAPVVRTDPPVVLLNWERCCKPYTPVGDKLVHSLRCPDRPGVALTPHERDSFRAEVRARMMHPAGKDRGVEPARAVPPSPALRENYVDAHLDDDDDLGPWPRRGSV